MKATTAWIVLAIVATLHWSAVLHADGLASGMTAFEKRDYAAAHEWFKAAAEDEDLRAAPWLAGDYYVGWGVAPDERQMSHWIERTKSDVEATEVAAALAQWRKLAESGDAAGQVMVGVAYEKGIGVTESPVEAYRWYKLAADQGYARGQYSLGAMYAVGAGVRRDPKEALRWFYLAAAQQDTWAQYQIAGAYLSGNGVRRSFDRAGEWFNKAANAGNSLAQYNLAVMYDQGDGYPRDYSEAFKWYRRASAQGVSNAQNNLAAMYYRGQGVPKDLKTAFQFSTLAHDQGGFGGYGEEAFDYAYGTIKNELSDSDRRAAVFELGVRCRDGNDVPRDAVQAYRYMLVSIQSEADQAVREARNKVLDTLAASMTQGQVNRARSMAASAPPP